MRKFFAIALFLFAANAWAQDHKSQFSMGGGLGATFAAPWASGNFRSLVGPKLPRVGVWANYTPGSPEVGVGLSYNYFSLSKRNLNTHAVIFSFFSRMLPNSTIHPNFAFGMGWAKTDRFIRSGEFESGIFQIRAGIDYDLAPNLDLSFYVDHFSVFRDQNNDDIMHVIAPVVAFTYYFGQPKQDAPAEPVKMNPAGGVMNTPATSPVAAPTSMPNAANEAAEVTSESRKPVPATQPKLPADNAKKSKKAKKKKKPTPANADSSEPTTAPGN